MSRRTKYSYLRFHEAVHGLNGSHTIRIAEKVGCGYRTALSRLTFMALHNVVFCKGCGSELFWYSNKDFTYDDFISFLLYVELKETSRLKLENIERNKALERFAKASNLSYDVLFNLANMDLYESNRSNANLTQKLKKRYLIIKDASIPRGFYKINPCFKKSADL